MILIRLLWRARKAPGYRKRWGERFGFVPAVESQRQVIWVHAVSVGETLAAVPMIKALQQRYPYNQIAVTTTTPTGSARVKAAFGDTVYHRYAPYDLPGALGRFLSRVKPAVLVIMETELWPNLIHSCHKRAIPVVVANARLSEKSAAGYRKFSAMTRPMLQQITCVAAQHSDDGERFKGLGLADSQLDVTGNIKFDLNIDAELRQRAEGLKAQWQINDRPVWLVASTHRGEDEIVLDAYGQLLDSGLNPLLVLVPRHPERFAEVADLCVQRGLNIVRRSQDQTPSQTDHVLLGDTMGELLLFFGACNIAFVGGSLVPVGGHNLIEPAAWGVPILSGPHLFNFSEASTLLLAAGGMAVCSDVSALSNQLIQLIADPELRHSMGQAALDVAESNRGALGRLMAIIERQLEHPPSPPG